MFKSITKQKKASAFATRAITPVVLESLENRQLLSGSHIHAHLAHLGHASVSSSSGGSHGHGHAQNTITANLLPGGLTGAVATELDTLSGTTLTATSTVYLGNSKGVETYTYKVSGTGTQSSYTVDENGNAITAPTTSTTTFSALPSAVSTEFTNLASDLGDTAPASTATVNVSTPSSGPAVYTLKLGKSSSSSSKWSWSWSLPYSVDANGNPVGNETVPFEALDTTIQNGLNALAPTGATALSSTSTQNVQVETVDGVVLYSTTFHGTGVRSTVTVNESGVATSQPSVSQTTFGALTSTVQTELQTLATADGYTGTIASTQSVTQYTEANGTVVYAVSVPVTKTGSSGSTYSINITVASDANGDPTTPPNDGGFGFGGGCGGFGFGGFGFGGGDAGGSFSFGNGGGFSFGFGD